MLHKLHKNIVFSYGIYRTYTHIGLTRPYIYTYRVLSFFRVTHVTLIFFTLLHVSIFGRVTRLNFILVLRGELPPAARLDRAWRPPAARLGAPLCLYASMPLCLYASMPLCLYARRIAALPGRASPLRDPPGPLRPPTPKIRAISAGGESTLICVRAWRRKNF